MVIVNLGPLSISKESNLVFCFLVFLGMETLVRDVRHGLITYKAVFRGKDLIDWINEADLVSNRQDGVNYCRNLIKGRVLRHVDNYLDFYDDNFLYTFSRNR